jgi:hypothetical protein
VKREAQDGKSVSVSLHASYEIRFTRDALSGDFATNRYEYGVDDVNLNRGIIRHGPGTDAARRETGRDHFPHHVSLGHDTGHFSSLKHEERADPLLRHRLRCHHRYGCEAIVYSAWPPRLVDFKERMVIKKVKEVDKA